MTATLSDGPPVVWLRLGNIGSATLERVLLSALPQIAAAGGGSASDAEDRKKYTCNEYQCMHTEYN